MPANGKEYELAIRISGIVDKNFNTSLVAANTKLGKFKATVSAMNSDFTKLDKGFDSVMKTGQKCFSVIATAAGVAAVAIGAATVASIAIGTEFESAFAGVKKTVDATAAEYEELRQNIRDMAKEIPSSTTEIAGVMEMAGQLGIAKDSLSDFTRVMINLGVSTNMAAEDAATALAKFANVTNMTNYDETGVSNYERLGSVIVDLGNNFATTEEDIVNMATNLAATGDMVGLSQAQIMALATAMSATGIKAEKGGTAMSKLLRKMQLAVETGSDSLADYARVSGMTGEQFSQTFTEDAVVALSAFIDGLNDTERNGMSAVAVLDDMGLSEVRLSDVILRLANSEGVMTNAIEMANEAWEENTALQIEAGKRYETTESQLQILVNSLNDLGITAYDELQGPFLDVISDVTDAVNGLNDDLGGANGISKWIKDIGIALPTLQRKIKTVSKPVLGFFNGLLEVGKWLLKNPEVIVGALSAIGTALITYKIASGITHVVNAIMSLTTLSPATLVILGIVAALSALGGAVGAYKTYRQGLVDKNLEEHFGNIALSLEDIKEIASYIVDTDALGGVREALSAFDKLDGISDTLQSYVDELNLMNWKVSIGMALTPEEQESYQQTITNYIADIQDYVLRERYAVGLNLELNNTETDIAYKVNQFYADSYAEMQGLGEELADAVNEAFSDDILDPEEMQNIADLQSKMAELKAKLATSELDAQLIKLDMKYNSGADLDADSFQNLQSELAAQVDAASESFLEAYARNVSAINNTYEAGGYLSYEKYQEALAAEELNYLNNITESLAKASQFQLDTINEVYGADITKAFDEVIGQYVENGEWDWLQRPGILFQGMITDLGRDKDFRTVRDSVEQLLEAMQPTIEEMEEIEAQYKAMGAEVPEAIASGLLQYEMLKGVVDLGGEEYYKALGEQIAKGDYKAFYEGVFSGLEENADSNGGLYAAVPDGLYDGFTAGEEELKKALESSTTATQNYITDWYKNYPFSAEAKLNITFGQSYIPYPKYSYGNTNSSLYPNFKIPVGARAEGGLATRPELTFFAENGPEMAIPIDGSKNAISLWEQTGRLLGMDSVLDNLSLEGGGTSTTIEYSPTLQFYGEAPKKEDIEDALRVSQDEFESLMERYLKTHSRVSLA